jgi:type II secretion system protein D
LEKLYKERVGLAARIETVADDRTNSVIVRGSPGDVAEVAALIKRIDLDKSDSVSQMRLFPLQNAVAEELAQVIAGAIESVLASGVGGPTRPRAGAGAGEPAGAGSLRQLEVAKSVVLQFLTSENGTLRTVRSGILEDIRVNFDARTNSLVVTAPQQSMQLTSELIRQLDKPTPLVADLKVFSLANADATAMVRLLENLYASQVQASETVVPVAGGTGAGDQLIPLRLSVDTRTNSIIAKGAPETLRVVEAILLRLDASDLRQRQNTVYRLRNSPAADVAKAINDFLKSQQNLAQIDPNLISTMELLEREVIVVPEPVSNSLLISSTPRYFDEIQALTKKLDEAPPQVIIQALLVEVDLDSDDELGVELGVQSSVLFDRSVISNLVTLTETTTELGTQTTTERLISQESNPGFPFNNKQLGNNTAVRPSEVGGQGLSHFNLGRTSAELGYGGLVLSAGSESLNVLIRALAARRRINVLSRPQIRTLDNQLAQIQVGEQVPVVDGFNIGVTGAINPLVRQDNAGIILTVTPRISPEGVIVMEVIAEKSQYTGRGVPILVDEESQRVVTSPIKDITTARTTVSVPNGQTIVLGGMITTLDDVIERKVPWLGDVPLLGHAFRYDNLSTRRTELLIFLTPRIIGNDFDSEMIKEVEMGRLHFCEHQATEIHGPLRGVPDQPIEMIPQPEEIPPGVPSYQE